MPKFNYEKPVTVTCLNCRETVTGIMDVNGRTKVKCPKCGTVTVSKVMGRRHVQVDVYAPQGQVLMQ